MAAAIRTQVQPSLGARAGGRGPRPGRPTPRRPPPIPRRHKSPVGLIGGLLRGPIYLGSFSSTAAAAGIRGVRLWAGGYKKAGVQ